MKILIADDEKNFVSFLNDYLSQRGYSVDIAYDGEEALTLVKSNTYDLVFLDHNMPELTGLELAKYMKEEKMKSKVVMITGYDEIAGPLAKAIGVDEYLTKPVRMEDLEHVIAKCGSTA